MKLSFALLRHSITKFLRMPPSHAAIHNANSKAVEKRRWVSAVRKRSSGGGRRTSTTSISDSWNNSTVFDKQNAPFGNLSPDNFGGTMWSVGGYIYTKNITSEFRMIGVYGTYINLLIDRKTLEGMSGRKRWPNRASWQLRGGGGWWQIRPDNTPSEVHTCPPPRETFPGVTTWKIQNIPEYLGTCPAKKFKRDK